MKYMIPVTVEVNRTLEGIYEASAIMFGGGIAFTEYAEDESDAWEKAERFLAEICARRCSDERR